MLLSATEGRTRTNSPCPQFGDIYREVPVWQRNAGVDHLQGSFSPAHERGVGVEELHPARVAKFLAIATTAIHTHTHTHTHKGKRRGEREKREQRRQQVRRRERRAMAGDGAWGGVRVTNADRQTDSDREEGEKKRNRLSYAFCLPLRTPQRHMICCC